MASSLFSGVQKPNPLQSAMQAVNMMRHTSPEQVMRAMMHDNPQFAEFINANKGKSPEQIASEHGIDINAIKRMFK